MNTDRLVRTKKANEITDRQRKQQNTREFDIAFDDIVIDESDILDIKDVADEPNRYRSGIKYPTTSPKPPWPRASLPVEPTSRSTLPTAPTAKVVGLNYTRATLPPVRTIDDRKAPLRPSNLSEGGYPRVQGLKDHT